MNVTVYKSLLLGNGMLCWVCMNLYTYKRSERMSWPGPMYVVTEIFI
jgi:hypothetical protein